MKTPFVWGAVVSCLTAAGALFVLNAQVEGEEPQAIYDRGRVILPSVIVGDSYYEMELQRSVEPIRRRAQATTREASAGVDFELIRSNKILDAPWGQAPNLKNGILRIPVIRWGFVDYRMEFRATDSTGKRFTLTVATPLTEPQEDYAVMGDGRGGYYFEPALPPPGFDRDRSIAAFQETLYPFLKNNICSTCHTSRNVNGSGAQAPMHTDWNAARAHDYALTRINFADTANSKFVVRMKIDRHNCAPDCTNLGNQILAAINDWKSRIADMLPVTERSVPAGTKIEEDQIKQWIADDRAQLSLADRDFIMYTSMHELHNEGLTAEELNIVRAGLSKALNSVARWAPKVVNPVDVNGLGILYKFDIRDYWGWNKGVTRLLFGGSDDDLAFGKNKRDYRGNIVTSSVQSERYNYTSTATWNPEFSKTIWERVLHGNVEGAVTQGTIPPYIDGFRGKRSQNAAGPYIAPQDFEWVETAQLIYTLTRPDVYNAIMMIPMTADQLEDELGVDKSKGMNSYDYIGVFDAITVDSRLLWRANTQDGGNYWKTWDVFSGQLAGGDRNIFDVYKDAGNDIRFPWWANPIPVFVNPNFPAPDTRTWSFIASLAQPFGNVPAGCDPQPNFSGIDGFYNCRHFTGTGGGQQSASEIIWTLPNGLNAYMLTGAFNQRRVDAFVNIVRDPRLIPTARDDIASQTGFTFRKQNGGFGGFNDPRLNVGSSCIGCHVDGMNRINNDMRDWLDEGGDQLPKGPYGADAWRSNSDTVKRVKELYPPSGVIRGYVEQSRQSFLGAMAQIKHTMLLGPNKNIYAEPVIWTVEYVQRKKYRYPQTTSN